MPSSSRLIASDGWSLSRSARALSCSSPASASVSLPRPSARACRLVAGASSGHRNGRVGHGSPRRPRTGSSSGRLRPPPAVRSGCRQGQERLVDRRCRRPRARVLRQHRGHERVQFHGYVGPPGPRGRRGRIQVVRAQRRVRRREERHVAGEQLQQQAAQRVDVGRGRDGLAEALLGRHVRGGADGAVDLGQPGQRPGAAQDRDAEVQHLHQAAVGDHHVAGLDIAVDDIDPMHVGQHRRDLRRDRRRPGHATAATTRNPPG